jgi:hypothetical protein
MQPVCPAPSEAYTEFYFLQIIFKNRIITTAEKRIQPVCIYLFFPIPADYRKTYPFKECSSSENLSLFFFGVVCYNRKLVYFTQQSQIVTKVFVQLTP